MKLRLRCLESKETLRIQVPSPCSLRQLQQTLSFSLSPSLPSSSSLHFSLNAKDELHAPSPDASLQSLGVAAGDLVYFSLNPNAFSRNISEEELQALTPPRESNQMPETPIQQWTPIRDSRSKQPEILHVTCSLGINSPVQESGSSESLISQETRILGMNCSNQETPLQGFSLEDQQTEEFSNNQVVGEVSKTESCALEDAEPMDMDDASVGQKFSVPYFLRRVLRKELGNERSNHKRLMTAVHAVLLESGFVGFDSVSRMRIEELHLPDEWPSSAFTLSLWYTLPQLLTRRDYGSNMTDCVVLKCQSLGHFITVYGSLVNGGSGLCRLCLDEYRFAPIIDLVWGHCDKSDMVDDAASLNPSPENEVFEFWKIVKDGLALPLLIDLCDTTDLALPACLIRLPTELKLKILESLSAVDIVNMGSVCSEMRYLASSNDLWKQKFAEEFGDGTGEQGMVNWREKFISHWERRKKQNLAVTLWQGYHHVERPVFVPIWREPNPFGGPLIIGGDHDRLPGLASPPPFVFGRPGQPFPRFRARQTFGPQCRFGGR